MEKTDRELLEEFLEGGSETAFRELTERHLPLVHSVAHRVTGNAEAARDVAQKVFLKLARRAARIPRTLPLTAWFHRETHSAAVDHVRSEVRRQRREQTAATLSAMNADTELWTDLAPVIDGAIDSLSRKDRGVVLLRFYQNKSYPEIARELGIREDAARMRTGRAVKKLRGILRRRGIATSAALLAATLPVHAVSAPPAALAGTISTAAVTGASAAAATTTTLTSLVAMTKTHMIAIAVVAIALPVIGLQQGRISSLKQENATLQSPAAATTRNGSSLRTERSDRTARQANRDSAKRSFAPADLQEILAESDPMARIRALLAYADGLAPADIPAALEELRKGVPEWDPDGKMLANMLLVRWAQEDPEAALASLNDMDFRDVGGEPGRILAGIAAIDPKRAAEWLDSPDNTVALYPTMGHRLAGTIAKEWVRQDPEAALAWADSLPDSQRAGALGGALGTLASSDPARASALAMDLEPGEARNHLVGEIASTWARNAPDKALSWARTLEGREQQSATRETLGTWAETDPTGAAQTLDQMTPRENVDRYVTSVAGAWAEQHPTAAANWVAGQAEGEGKNEAMGHVMWHWTTRDSEAAAHWLMEQDAGPARDAGIGGLAKAAFEFDPGGALSWATDINNDEFRRTAVAIGLREWTKRDPEAARQWAEQNGVEAPAPQDTSKNQQSQPGEDQ